MYRQIRILVADDEEHDRFFVKRAFMKAGINVAMEMVEDGGAVVKYLGGVEPFADRKVFPLPDLVLLDLKMPVLDGFEVLRWIREQPGLRQMPVICLSSSALKRDVDMAHELGANGYSMKPSGAAGMQDFVRGIEAYWLRCHCYPSLGVWQGDGATRAGLSAVTPFGNVRATGREDTGSDHVAERKRGNRGEPG